MLHSEIIAVCSEIHTEHITWIILYIKTQSVPRSKHSSSRLHKPVSQCRIGKCTVWVERRVVECLTDGTYSDHNAKNAPPYSQGQWQDLGETRKETDYIPRILWNLEVHYHIHNSPPRDPILAKSIHSSAHHTFDRRSLFSSWSS